MLFRSEGSFTTVSSLYFSDSKAETTSNCTKARKALYVSKMSMCILTGGTVVVMCVAIYWDLCKSYMNIPFKIVTIVLTSLLVGNMRKIVQYNEMNR